MPDPFKPAPEQNPPQPLTDPTVPPMRGTKASNTKPLWRFNRRKAGWGTVSATTSAPRARA